MSFCRFETVKTDTSDTYCFYIRVRFLRFSLFTFPFYKGALEYEQEEQYMIKTHPLPRELARDELELKVRIFHLENYFFEFINSKITKLCFSKSF